MVQNRFYVHPGGDIGSGLAGLGETIQRGMAIKGAREAKEKAAQETARVRTAMMTAMQSGNDDDIEALFIENPELAMAVRKFKGFEDDESRETQEEELSQKMIAGDKDAGRELLSLNPERFGKIRKGLAGPEKKDTRTAQKKNYDEAVESGYTKPFHVFVKGKDSENIKTIKESMIEDRLKEFPGETRGQAGLHVEKELAEAKRGRGIEISYGADGKPVINIGGSKGMTRKTKGALETDVLEMDSQLIKAERIIEQFEPEFLTIGGKARGAYLNIKDKVFGELTADESKYVTEISTFRQNALESINSYINAMTGAAMSNAESKRLREGVADAGDGILTGDGPTKFIGKLRETIKKGKLAKARSILMLEKGITVSDKNVADIELKYNYNDVQNMLNIKANELGAAYELKYPNKSDVEIRSMVKKEIKRGYGI